MCCRYYSDQVMVSFPNQIKSEYYVGNISASKLKAFNYIPSMF